MVCMLIEGGTDKHHPGQNLKDKRQSPKTKSPHKQLRENLYRGLLSGFLVLGLLKIGGGSEMCDVVWGGSRDVWQSVTGGGGKNWPKVAWRTLWTVPKTGSRMQNSVPLDQGTKLKPSQQRIAAINTLEAIADFSTTLAELLTIDLGLHVGLLKRKLRNPSNNNNNNYDNLYGAVTRPYRYKGASQTANL